ncbi:MAG: hypothetical protein M1816_003621 [Peltula sp. TS41687]|nr:MAG: hypothetical protein M1816_003621 [Peltula sp. TS41687]
MSAPGPASLGPPGLPAPRRGGTTTPALPSAPRRIYCLRCVKWLGTASDHVCLQKANRTRCDRCSKTGLVCAKIPLASGRSWRESRRTPPPSLASRTPAAAQNALFTAATTLGSRVDKHNRRMKNKSGDRKLLSLVERNTLRFQESLLARLESFESAYRTAHGQPQAAADDDNSDDDEEDDGGDDGGDGGDGGIVGAGS